jgi:uncharacterized LabA/DUF88 family protein
LYNDLMRTVLFVDGENFLHKIKEVLKEKKTTANLSRFDFNSLLKKTLGEYKLTEKIFYAAKLHAHPDTKDKSKELVLFQRYLKTNLEKQGFIFQIAGNVRSQKVGNKLVFREKGVDVKIAVDMVSRACEKDIDIAILCSSDSDLQPAVEELRKRKVRVIYVGFEINPNKGLTYTTSKTILFRNSEIIESLKK